MSRKKKSQFAIPLAVLGLLVLTAAFGFYFKKSREAKIARLVEEKSRSSTVPSSVPVYVENGVDEQGRPMLKPVLTPEEIKKREQQEQQAMRFVESAIMADHRRIDEQIRLAAQKVYRGDEFNRLLQTIEDKNSKDPFERGVAYMDLRNQIASSRTPLAEKKRMVGILEAKAGSISIPTFLGYDKKKSEEAYEIWTPKFSN